MLKMRTHETSANSSLLLMQYVHLSFRSVIPIFKFINSHCTLTINCIGYFNRKIFILLLFYGALTTFMGFLVGLLSANEIITLIIVLYNYYCEIRIYWII